MSTSNSIFLVLWVLILATGYLWINKNKHPKINAWLVNAYQFFNFKKKILEVEFDLNNNSNELKNYITDPKILENFNNKVCKKIYIHSNPKPTTSEINQYFAGIYLQAKLLFEGLACLNPKKTGIDFTKNFFDFVNIQADEISSSSFFEDLNYKSRDSVNAIEGLFINDPKIGFKVLIDKKIENLKIDGVDNELVYDWLTQNKGTILNINPSNTVFKVYYTDLVEFIKTKMLSSNNSTDENLIVYQMPITRIEELFIEPMTKDMFINNYRKIGLFDNVGNFTGKISNFKNDSATFTKFPKNAIYKLFESLIFVANTKEKYMKAFPVNLTDDDKARLITEFLNLPEPITGNDIVKSNANTTKFDNIDKTLKSLKMEFTS
jgi:hypothetical protein